MSSTIIHIHLKCTSNSLQHKKVLVFVCKVQTTRGCWIY